MTSLEEVQVELGGIKTQLEVANLLTILELGLVGQDSGWKKYRDVRNMALWKMGIEP